MTRTTIVLPRSIKSMALSAARKRNMNFSEFIRTAIVETAVKNRAVPKDNPLWEPIVLDVEVEPDLSRNIDKYLYDEPRPRRGKKART